ncbi:MAG TPA: stage II sporulation protein M [Capsulimonadaceae bacterium]|nr:stage II sporulation protein M [Capsulimonadaceae bacterium]
MFDERTFIAKKQNQWRDLADIVQRIKSFGLRRLPGAASPPVNTNSLVYRRTPGDLERLGSLYRRTCADLAYARTQRATPELIYYLNELVGDAHGVLYVEHSNKGPLAHVRDFFAYDLPDVLRRRMPFTATAFLLTVLGILMAYFMVRHDPNTQGLFIPAQFRSSIDAWKRGFADKGDVSAGNGALFSSYLMTHNTFVGIIAFATGITLLIPFYLMLDNGFVMGALIAVVQPTGYLRSMWPGLAPHGVCELSAIFICGGAGFLIGWALINPGKYSRRDALMANGRDALMMMFGTVPLFIVAGIIEANVSHSSLPHWAKYTLAAVQFLALAAYIYATPRRPASETLSNPNAPASGYAVVKA